MPLRSFRQKDENALAFDTDVSDAQMVSGMRLVLAVAVLLAIFIDAPGLSGVDSSTWFLFSGYVFHSLVIYIYSQLKQPLSRGKLIHWLDVFWYVLIVFFTGGTTSFFFLFFFFAIITSSFRWGFEEGARITMVSAALFVASGLGFTAGEELPRLLLRTIFLLVFGYLSAHWGGTEAELKRRLAVLRDVSRLSNPRFGVDHTITGVLEKTRLFFRGSSCMLVMRDNKNESYTLRIVKESGAKQSITAEPVSVQVAAPLMTLSQHHIVAYIHPFWRALALHGGSSAYDIGTSRWINHDGKASERLADLLGARSFISAPLSLRKQECRIFVLSHGNGFSKSDALFLSHISSYAFPVIENIELLDRMASEAALQERHKIAWDLHDTAVQPYIGLKLGLSALRNKASADNPLIEDLEKLNAMAARVMDDLRRYAGTFRTGSRQTEPIFLLILRQQVAQVREFYGIEITVHVEGGLRVSDRLTAEVMQIVREGLSNICRHTLARRGFVGLRCVDNLLSIDIENEGMGAQSVDFMPRSIMDRASALGGKTQVKRQANGSTAVHIKIPV